jgi:hypothetical protein
MHGGYLCFVNLDAQAWASWDCRGAINNQDAVCAVDIFVIPVPRYQQLTSAISETQGTLSQFGSGQDVLLMTRGGTGHPGR